MIGSVLSTVRCYSSNCKQVIRNRAALVLHLVVTIRPQDEWSNSVLYFTSHYVALLYF